MKKRSQPHPLVVALGRLQRDDRRRVDWYLDHKRATVFYQTYRVLQIERRRKVRDSEIAGTELFLQMEDLKKRKRRFRKIVRKLTKGFGSNYPKDEYFWEMIAHRLASIAGRELAKYQKERKKRWQGYM